MGCLIPGRFGTRGPLAILVMIGVLQAGASVVLIRAVDRLLNTAPDEAAVAAIIGPVIAVAVLAAGRLAELWQAERLAQQIIHAQRTRLASQLLNLAPRGPKSGRSEVLLRFMGEMSALRSWHMRAVPVLVIGIPVVIGGITALGIRDPRLALAVSVPVLLAVALQIALSSRHFAAAERTRRTRTRLAGTVSRHFEALAAVQAFGRTGSATREIERRSKGFSHAMVDRALHAGLLRAAAEFGATGILIAILVVWFLIPDLDPASLAGALAFAAVLSPRLRALGRVPEQLNLARVAARRIEAFLAEPLMDDRRDGAGIARREGRLKLRDIAIEGLFEGFSAEAEPGSRVLVQGANGAGKSRLFGLIAGLEDPDAGRIVLDGRDIGRRRRSSLRKLVAVAGNGMPLMAGRVADNLACGARVTEAERAGILALCGWERLEASLPDGARTRIETGAPNLSAGQRARLGLIRALLRKPQILIIDEIDSALDAEGREILDAVLGRFEGTVLIASHDRRWSHAVDRIWTLPQRDERRIDLESEAHV